MINPISGRPIKENGDVYYDLKKIGYIDIGRLVPGHFNFAYQKKRYDAYGKSQFLPQELICIIYSYCDLQTSRNLRRCCTAYYDISISHHDIQVPALKYYFSSHKDIKYIIGYINAYHTYFNYDVVKYALRQLEMKDKFQFELIKSIRDIKAGSYIAEIVSDIFIEFIAEKLGKSIQEAKSLYGYCRVFGLLSPKSYTIRDLRTERYEQAHKQLIHDIYSFTIPQLELLVKDNGLGSKVKINKNNVREATKELRELLLG